MKKLLFAALFLFTLSVIIPSCVKTDFDEPPTTGSTVDVADSDVVTIKSLKDLHVSQAIETIADLNSGAFKGKYLKGVVSADDETGNFYKNFILQDATGGINIRVARSDAYPFYSEGRIIYIKLEGLLMGDYRGVTQLGGFLTTLGELGDIVDLEEFVLTGERGQAVEANTRTISELGRDDISTLIRLDDVEFAGGDINSTYADAINLNTENRDIVDCNGNVIVVRTSGFADFAGADIPDGGGSVVGIYSIFESGSNVTQQLLLRRASDVVMEGERCDGSGGGPIDVDPITEFFEDFNSGADGATVSIAGWSNFAVQESRQWLIGQFQGASYADIGAFNASGPVEAWLISPPINLTGSRYLSFTSAYAFYAHQGLELVISTDFVSGGIPADATWTNLSFDMPDGSQEWNTFIPSGDLDIASYGDQGHIAFKYTGDGNTAETTTWIIDDICISADPCSGTGGCPDNDEDGVCAADDCDDNDPAFPMTPGTTCDDGNADTTDDVIQADGCICAGQGGALSELVLNLESLSLEDNADFVAPGWTNVATVGSRKWQFNLFDDNAEIRASAFNDTEPAMEAWLVTPLIDFNAPKKISFLNGHAFYAHDGLSTWFSNDFTGDPTSATWTEVSINYANSAAGNYEVFSTGDISLSQFSGNGVIGFKYTGNPDDQTTTWIIDELSIVNE
ncbi:MAG: hypothetical protein ACI85O_001677 [Saprospiraceae bacterium]|jgi:hypothetical protein